MKLFVNEKYVNLYYGLYLNLLNNTNPRGCARPGYVKDTACSITF